MAIGTNRRRAVPVRGIPAYAVLSSREFRMMFPLSRRAALAGLGAALPLTARAQPARPVTLVVPYAAGGGTDIIGREFALGFGPALGQTVVVDNRGGAAGHVGSVSVARSRPDGTTLLFAVSTNA
ncbi:tripartite tricarboxylate transporter substrate-binding protein [Roseicella sp. DB1501]|uniref:tripartite tricarboxylate transporter substrate-binding protein n=1 Tax=Roseicella sp. DB1501 TaxID=2730925 RepID=UPI0020C4C26E|nr:tripartite tricarboxylate transporter substrate-binding protein [Roseicella sp. DB1501]